MSEARNYWEPPHVLDAPTVRYLWRRMHVNNKNVMVCLVGDPGDGKSWAALRLAELLDPWFSAEKVAFRPRRLLERIDEDQPPGDITVADEAGVSLNAKTWWESDQIQIGNILETWRHQNRGMIFTLPVFNKLQKDARGLIDVLMTAWGIDRKNNQSLWRFQLVETNNVTGDVIYPYLKAPAPGVGQETKYRTLTLDLPSPELREAYQERKEEYTNEINQQALESAKEAEQEEEETDPREVATEIAKDGVEEFVAYHGVTGKPYINKDLIRATYDLSLSDASMVKSLLDAQIDLEEYEE